MCVVPAQMCVHTHALSLYVYVFICVWLHDNLNFCPCVMCLYPHFCACVYICLHWAPAWIRSLPSGNGGSQSWVCGRWWEGEAWWIRGGSPEENDRPSASHLLHLWHCGGQWHLHCAQRGFNEQWQCGGLPFGMGTVWSSFNIWWVRHWLCVVIWTDNYVLVDSHASQLHACNCICLRWTVSVYCDKLILALIR